MRAWVCLTLLGLLGPHSFIEAQSSEYFEVYPVRLQHRIGYIKMYRLADGFLIDTVRVPRYHFISERALPWNHPAQQGAPSPYRLFEIHQKVGLLNEALEEVLPAAYQQVRAVAPDYFAVKQEGLFVLQHRSGNRPFGQKEYHDICLADLRNGHPSFFFVKKANRWGLRSLDGRTLFPPQFAELRRTGTPGFYKAKKELHHTGWLLIDTTGQPLLPDAFQDVEVLNPHLIAVRDGDWFLLEQQQRGYRKISPPLVRVEPLSGPFFSIIPKVKEGSIEELWYFGNTGARRVAAFPAVAPAKAEKGQLFGSRFLPLNDEFVVFDSRDAPESVLYQLLDARGRRSSTVFAGITPTAHKGLFQISNSQGVGLLQPAKDSLPVLDFIFRSIEPFRGKLARTHDRNTLGVVSFFEGVVDTLPCIYDNLILLGDTAVRAQLGEQVLVFTLDSLGQWQEPEQIFTEGMLIGNSVQKDLREALPIEKTKPTKYYPSLNDRSSQSLLVLERVGTKWYLRKRAQQSRFSRMETLWEDTLPFQQKPAGYRELKADEVLAFWLDKQPAESKAAQLLGKGRPLARIHLFHRKEQEILETPALMGYRLPDTSYPYTAYLDTSGQMGLMTPAGKIVRKADGAPLTYTYVGPWRAGRARACRGGVWYVPSPSDQSFCRSYHLGSIDQWQHEFQIRPLGEETSRRGLEPASNSKLYVRPQAGQNLEWGYINTRGQWIASTTADFVEDYHWQDSTALIYRTLDEQDPFGYPRSAVGMINYRGEEVVPTTYLNIIRYRDYYLIIKKGSPVFYYTSKGHQIFVNPTRLRPFSDGLSQFKDEDTGLWGYVDKKGVVRLSPQFLKCRPFSEGLALVVDREGQCHYIDTSGQVRFSPAVAGKNWERLGDLHCGRIWFRQAGKAPLWGCWNAAGKEVLPPRYFYYSPSSMREQDQLLSLPMDFVLGKAIVQTLGSDGKPRHQLIDTAGQSIPLPPKVTSLEGIQSNGCLIFSSSSGKGVLDTAGRVVVPPEHHRVFPYINGFARVGNHNGAFGLVNEQGEWVLPLQFAAIDAVSEGMAAVKTYYNAGWEWYRLPKGEKAFKGVFDQVQPYVNGITMVKTRAGEYQLIDRTGKEQLIEKGHPVFYQEEVLGLQTGTQDGKPTYIYSDAYGNNLLGGAFFQIHPPKRGVAMVKRTYEREQFGAIHMGSGRMIVPPKYGMVHIQPNGDIMVNPQRLIGMIDKKGRVLLPPRYDRIEQFAEAGIFRVERGEAMGYFYLTREGIQWIWPLTK